MKEGSLFYLSLIKFEVCGSKENIIMVIKEKYEKLCSFVDAQIGVAWAYMAHAGE